MKIFAILLLFISLAHAKWSGWTHFGYGENGLIVIKYRMNQTSYGGTEIQFSAINRHTEAEYIRLTRREFLCVDGTVQSRSSESSFNRIAPGNSYTPVSDSNLCVGSAIRSVNMSAEFSSY